MCVPRLAPDTSRDVVNSPLELWERNYVACLIENCWEIKFFGSSFNLVQSAFVSEKASIVDKAARKFGRLYDDFSFFFFSRLHTQEKRTNYFSL